MAEKIEITFLGTGTSTPTVKRNHTGILLSYADENILVDCGEGIQRQFKKAKISPCKLTKLLITHWHGDHTLGITGLLETLAMSEYQKKLFIYGPKGTKEKLNLLQKVYGRFKIDFEVKEISTGKITEEDFVIESMAMSHGTATNAYSFSLKDKSRIDKDKLKKLKLPNSPLIKELAEGKDIIIENKKIRSKDLTYLENGKKITFILDTGMNANTIKIARDSDILICESSFSAEEKEKAKEYKHLTSIDAATIAKKSNSKKLLLVHISQRYEHNTKPLLEQCKKIFKDSSIPNDLDKISL